MSEREAAVELPFAADCCPCVEKLRTVLPSTVGIRGGVVRLVPSVGSGDVCLSGGEGLTCPRAASTSSEPSAALPSTKKCRKQASAWSVTGVTGAAEPGGAPACVRERWSARGRVDRVELPCGTVQR
jgi:hypothetical protein